MIRVVGTAGHVDHGKSSLVQALTGMNPDRLREEQERQMTIDLGFAWMELPDGTSLGWVDVPGHRDFIENMLAGVSGIDAALLVVAADEGIMPQTREHVAILDLLEVERLLVVLTKIDLVFDAGWLGLVRDDLLQLLASTRFAEAPIVEVSSASGQGLDELVRVLTGLLREAPIRPDHGRPRLPVDRVFSMPGFGTVATGTLTDGGFAVGEEVVVLPVGRKARLRGLQTHRQRVEAAVAGSRVAANLAGVDVGEVRRGDVIAREGTYPATRRIDVQIRVLADAVADVEHLQAVKIHVGSSERMAHVRLVEGSKIAGGMRSPAQLEFEQPVVVARGDRFILRRPAPGATLGGGVVLDPSPARRYRRGDRDALRHLEALDTGTQADLVLEAARRERLATLSQLARGTGLDGAAVQAAVEDLESEGRLVPLASSGWMPRERWDLVSSRLIAAVRTYHEAYPLRPGMPKEELRSRTQVDSVEYGAITDRLVEEGRLREGGARVSLAGHVPSPGREDQQRLSDLLARFAAAPAAPPSVSESKEALGSELLAFALEKRAFVQVSDDVLFREEDYSTLVAGVTARLEKGPATVAEIRDLLGSSRRYVLALLEHLDRQGLTIRDGDERRLAKGKPAG